MKDERDVLGNYNPYGNPLVFILGLILAILILVFVFGATGERAEDLKSDGESDSHRITLVMPI